MGVDNAMSRITNALGQPVGPAVEGWTHRALPSSKPILGRTCLIEKLDFNVHGDDLHGAFGHDADDSNWTYLTVGPFAERPGFDGWLASAAAAGDPFFYAIVDRSTGNAVGVASLMRIDPANGVIEVGCIHFSPLLQRTVIATESMYLLMRHVFDELGYRRYEWKCDALNAPSRRAAERFGFTYEGLFRQAMIYKGRTRDTAWYSIIDTEWAVVRTAFETWLDPGNFDASGSQRRSLGMLMHQERL